MSMINPIPNPTFIKLNLLIIILFSLTQCDTSDTTPALPEQASIRSYKGIDSVLNTLSKISFKELPDDYKLIVGYDNSTLRKQLKDAPFYIITGSDLSKKLVGDFTINDFISKDSPYLDLISSKSDSLVSYFTIDNSLLYKMLDLQYELEKQGYDHNAFYINFGHRSPQCNDLVGGANGSRHMRGQAVDIVIKDIDQNGITNDEDKQIVLDIVENKIIGDKGGVGRYPGSMVIHFDTRGYKARWDHQKKKK